LFTLLDLCVSSLCRGNANLLCIVPILTDDPRRESILSAHLRERAGPSGLSARGGVSLRGGGAVLARHGRARRRIFSALLGVPAGHARRSLLAAGVRAGLSSGSQRGPWGRAGNAASRAPGAGPFCSAREGRAPVACSAATRPPATSRPARCRESSGPAWGGAARGSSKAGRQRVRLLSG